MRNERPDTPVATVWRQFGRNHLAVFALIMVLVLFGVAALADFIANDKPLVMKYQNRFYFPVLKDYAVRLGMTRWQREFQNISYKAFAAENFKQGDWAQFPPIRYSQNDVSLATALRPPSAQHLLGTDEIGRDIASRIVHGSRVSLSVGFVAVSIYVLIGLLIGALAGYYEVSGLCDRGAGARRERFSNHFAACPAKLHRSGVCSRHIRSGFRNSCRICPQLPRFWRAAVHCKLGVHSLRRSPIAA